MDIHKPLQTCTGDDAYFCNHGEKGAEILRRNGFPDDLCNLIANHGKTPGTITDPEKQRLLWFLWVNVHNITRIILK